MSSYDLNSEGKCCSGASENRELESFYDSNKLGPQCSIVLRITKLDLFLDNCLPLETYLWIVFATEKTDF